MLVGHMCVFFCVVFRVVFGGGGGEGVDVS